MKISKSRIQQIINEELKVLKELVPGDPGDPGGRMPHRDRKPKLPWDSSEEEIDAQFEDPAMERPLSAIPPMKRVSGGMWESQELKEDHMTEEDLSASFWSLTEDTPLDSVIASTMSKMLDLDPDMNMDDVGAIVKQCLNQLVDSISLHSDGEHPDTWQ